MLPRRGEPRVPPPHLRSRWFDPCHPRGAAVQVAAVVVPGAHPFRRLVSITHGCPGADDKNQFDVYPLRSPTEGTPMVLYMATPHAFAPPGDAIGGSER